MTATDKQGREVAIDNLYLNSEEMPDWVYEAGLEAQAMWAGSLSWRLDANSETDDKFREVLLLEAKQWYSSRKGGYYGS